MPQERISIEKFKALSPEDQEAVLLNSRAQMILDLINAAAIPFDLRTLTAMQLGMERIAGALEKVMNDEDLKEKPSELYLASNMNDAMRGGSHKVIFDGKG